ncbi:hypothetical protein M419DRAFT_9408 [Trichoderma reesei RUT C-30]|uniref:Uncharacterized protein n=1 Tax=Hypocrea jecorina (strain ATCC 56765 / BCRC 32924 / NRRL 11460 / Rut C-30) TaxID=1344414 RepID=A0A024S9U7_HYPJR|nr:hypothetical protein M419DRAFT_9408 [Trichoderma reesei RUT C-30]
MADVYVDAAKHDLMLPLIAKYYVDRTGISSIDLRSRRDVLRKAAGVHQVPAKCNASKDVLNSILRDIATASSAGRV